jgi:hypothetical protein
MRKGSYPEDSPQFLRAALQAARERRLREKIAEAKRNLGTMPSSSELLAETHAQRAHRRAIQTLARLEQEADTIMEDRRRVIARSEEMLGKKPR